MAETTTNSTDPQQIAKRYIEQIPAPSSLFTTCIRAIKNAEMALHGGDLMVLKDLTISSTAFILSVSPTLKAVFYRAAENIHPKELKELNPLSTKALIGLFQPNEVTAILTITYLYRHLKKVSNSEDYAKLIKKLLTHAEIGAIVGRTIRNIGTGNGMLLGGLRYFSLALIMLADAKKFQDYYRKAERNDKLFDLVAERQIFGCTHLDIAGHLARIFGFGLITTSGFMLAHAKEAPSNFSEQMEEELLCWRVAFSLTEAFHEKGSAPEVDESSELYLPPEESASLKKQCWEVIRDGCSYTWLTAAKNDLPEEIRRALEITIKGSQKLGIEDLEEGEDGVA